MNTYDLLSFMCRLFCSSCLSNLSAYVAKPITLYVDSWVSYTTAHKWQHMPNVPEPSNHHLKEFRCKNFMIVIASYRMCCYLRMPSYIASYTFQDRHLYLMATQVSCNTRDGGVHVEVPYMYWDMSSFRMWIAPHFCITHPSNRSYCLFFWILIFSLSVLLVVNNSCTTNSHATYVLT